MSAEVLSVIRRVSKVLRLGKIRKAEAIVLKALEEYEGPVDSWDRRTLFSELIEVYGMAEPPMWEVVERLCQEREQIWPDAFAKLQTGMRLFWGQHDYERAIPKLREAVETGRTQHKEYDTIIVYQALSTLGHALLKLGRQAEAVEALGEIEAMIPGRVVVGDETSFLEAMVEQRLALDRVAKLAAVLAPVSREAAFRERLKLVAERASALIPRPLND